MIEILVAAVITAIITTAAVQVYLTQHRTYLWQEQLSDMNMNAQFAMDQISNRISYAGYGIPEGLIAFADPDSAARYYISSIMASNSNPDTVTIIAKSPIHGAYGVELFGIPGGDTTYDPIIFAGGRDSVPFDGAGTYDSIDLAAGDFALIASYNSTATEICSIENVLQPRASGDGPCTYVCGYGNWMTAYPWCSYIVKVEFYKYYLDTTSNNIMLITRSDPDTAVVAENVDSLNFTYTYHLASGDSTLDEPIPFVPVKTVNISLTARTARMKKDVYGNSAMDTTTTGGYSYLTLNNTVKIKSRGVRLICF